MAKQPNLGRFGKTSSDPVNDADISFNWEEEYSQYQQDCECLLPVSQFDAALLLSLLRSEFSKNPERWEDVGAEQQYTEFWHIIKDAVCCLEAKLVMCTDGSTLNDMMRSNLLLVAAITGQRINLDAPEDYLTGWVDYRMMGLANRLGPEELQGGLNTLQSTLVDLASKVQELEDELASIKGSLDDQTEAMGGTPSEPPEPL